MIKYCEDCLWFKEPNDCVNPKNFYEVERGPNFVTRKAPQTKVLVRRWTCASTKRDFGWLMSRLSTGCGKEGRWFEPKAKPVP